MGSRYKSDAELDRAVRERYTLTAHNSLMLRNLIRKANVLLLSKLPDEIVRGLGLHPVKSLEEGIQKIQQEFQGDFTCAFYPPREHNVCAN